jgi:hypothetical protein
MPAVISLDTSSVVETIFLPGRLALFNGLHGVFDDIVQVKENLDCSVLMNHLSSYDEYPIHEVIFSQS